MSGNQLSVVWNLLSCGLHKLVSKDVSWDTQCRVYLSSWSRVHDSITNQLMRAVAQEMSQKHQRMENAVNE